MITCTVCRKKNVKILFPLENNKFYIGKCLDCNLIFTYPQPAKEELAKYYNHNYYSFNELSAKSMDRIAAFRIYVRRIFLKHFYGQNKKLNWKEKILLFLFQNRLGPIPIIFKEIGKILDVGAGDGFFLNNAKNLGWEVRGVELNERAANFASKQGLNVFAGTLEEAKYPDEYFNVVRLSHVLEHTYNPLDTLREVYRILKPGGVVIIKIPNFNSLAIKIFKIRIGVPEHLFHFTVSALNKLLTKRGFKKIKIKYYSVGMIQPALPNFFQNVIFTPIFILFDNLLNLLHLGDSFVIIGYKN